LKPLLEFSYQCFGNGDIGAAATFPESGFAFLFAGGIPVVASDFPG
jgi:hypothetical protein